MQALQILPMASVEISELQKFCDLWIGKDYFSLESLMNYVKNSPCSYVARVDGELAGVRFTLGPGKWLKSGAAGGGKGVSVEEWRVPPEKVAYFKSLFIAQDFQKMGIGKKLSGKSMECLRELGAEAIVCHSWLESPGNSSQKYLQSMGFEPVKTHPKFWHDIAYTCSGCGKDRCVCTAVEMIKYL